MAEARSLRLLLRFSFGVLLVALAGCTDTAVVGVNLEQADSSTSPARAGCEPACSADELCQPELHICVRCLIDDDCARDADAPFCDAQRFVCVECRSSADCGFQAPRCDEGTCRTCVDSPNCSGDHCAHADDACRIDNRGPSDGSGGGGGHPR